jgi:3-oxoadipate enol-lactonase
LDPGSHIDVGGHALWVVSEGHDEAGPAFLCLHGLVDSLLIWDRVAGSLAARARLVRYDQRGHGESGAPAGPYRREDLAMDGVRVMDALGLDRAIWVGHSMGGIVSMTAALAHPDRVAGLVLIGTASQCSEKVSGWYERIASAGEAEGRTGLTRAIYGKATTRSVVGDPRGIAHVTRTLKSLYDEPLTPGLARIACPALLLVGEKDPMGPAASSIIASKLPDAHLEVLPGLGHWVHVEAPDAFSVAVDRWRSQRMESR